MSAIDTTGMRVADSSALNDEDERTAPDNAVPCDQLKDVHMMTESGTELGTLADVHLDTDAREVIAYVLSGSPATRFNRVEPSVLAGQVLRRDERGNLVVTDAAAQEVNRPDWKIEQGYIER